jgi:hypothetical protein
VVHRREPILVAFAAAAALGLPASAVAAPRWDFAVNGTSTLTLDLGVQRVRDCDPTRYEEPMPAFARYETTLAGRATVRKRRIPGTRGRHFAGVVPLSGTVAQRVTEAWDEHPCAAGQTAAERSCSAAGTNPVNGRANALALGEPVLRPTGRATVDLRDGGNSSALTFPRLVTHCRPGLFDPWVERLDCSQQFCGTLSRKVRLTALNRRRGSFVLRGSEPSMPSNPGMGTVTYRVTISWRRVG